MMSSPLFTPFTLNVGGRLVLLERPWIMGILNVTPDSFYEASRCSCDEAAIVGRVDAIVEEGGDIIDIGAYSSRPGADDVSLEEEWRRLDKALAIVRKLYPAGFVSVDTFRAEIARRCVEEYGVQMVNDISGGTLDDAMFETIAKLQVPYVLMHMRGTPQTMQQNTGYADLMADMTDYFVRRIDRLHQLGVGDIILDPGFGFGKTLEDNYRLIRRLDEFRVLEKPLLVGISRKSMIYKLLDCSPEESLTGTIVLGTMALLAGASILRVHDVREAVQTVKIVTKTVSV
ncbi:MAG: dihydropteroate synthase [Porphyromonadaceae bacterium]|nr:dihydropteroate synthase [Porphyromonadaceae bacterium]